MSMTPEHFALFEKMEPDPQFRIVVEIADFERENKGAKDEIVVIKKLPDGQEIGHALLIPAGSEITQEQATMASFGLTAYWKNKRATQAA